jgi:glycosyltransferase involved in cell wall biosynthesis
LAGVETEIVTTGDDRGGDGEIDCICFRRNFQPYKISFSLRRWLNRHIGEFDLVHIHALFSFSSWAAASAAQKQRVPYVIRPLGVLNRWGLTNRRRLLKQVWLRFVEGPILERAAAIHYTSDSERDEAALIGGEIAQLRSFVIPIPVGGSLGASDAALRQSISREHSARTSGSRNFTAEGGEVQRTSAFAESGAIRPAFSGEDEFLQTYPKAREKKIVLFLARLDEKKGLDLLLQAFADVRQEHGDSVLVIAGDGQQQFVERLHRQAEDLGIANDIIWTGFLSGPQKTAAFSAAQVYVLPSYSENFGIAAAEALTFGVPTVLSDQVAIAGDAAAAGASVMVRPDAMEIARAIKQLLKDPPARETLSRNGKQFAQRSFSTERVSEQLVSEYRKILNLN